MNHYLILCRSVTQAQRARLLLHNAGISCQIYRAPAGLSRRGCGYVVRIRERPAINMDTPPESRFNPAVASLSF